MLTFTTLSANPPRRQVVILPEITASSYTKAVLKTVYVRADCCFRLSSNHLSMEFPEARAHLQVCKLEHKVSTR